jgi:hypothetical protein
MTRRKRALDPPEGGHGRKRLQDEVAAGEPDVRDGEPPRAVIAAAPQKDVEVEHSRSPAASAPAAPIAFDLLEPFEQLWGLKRSFDQRDRIGEIPPGAAMGRVEEDGRGGEQLELALQPLDRRLDNPPGRAEASVRAVGADGDGE